MICICICIYIELFYWRLILSLYLTVNGNWGSWSPYTECSATCGGAQKERIRLCNNPPSANGGLDCLLTGTADQRAKEESDSATCNENACPGKVSFNTDGQWRKKQTAVRSRLFDLPSAIPFVFIGIFGNLFLPQLFQNLLNLWRRRVSKIMPPWVGRCPAVPTFCYTGWDWS